MAWAANRALERPLSSSPQGALPVQCGDRDVIAVTDQIRAVSKERLDRRMDTLLSSTWKP
jgi:hypothetical protein